MSNLPELLVIPGDYHGLSDLQERISKASTRLLRLRAVLDATLESTVWLSHTRSALEDEMTQRLYDADEDGGVRVSRNGPFVGITDGYVFPFHLGNWTTFARSQRPSPDYDGPLDQELLSHYGLPSFDVVLGRDLLERRQEAMTLPRRTPGMDCSPVFGLPTRKPDVGLCFVLMPFSEEWSNRIWQRHLQPAIRRAAFAPERADDIFSPNVLVFDIWNAIAAAAVILADVTGNNPNVLYELGIAHTLGKKVVIICQEGSRRPFDTSHWRHILYQDNSEGCEKLETALVRTLRTIRDNLGPDRPSGGGRMTSA